MAKKVVANKIGLGQGANQTTLGAHEMTREELQEIGREMYGPAWKAKMARDLARSPATVFNWVAGRIAIPKTAERRIRDLAARHLLKDDGQ